MPKVSQNKVTPKIYNEMMETLVASFAKTSDQNMVRLFIRDLFTPNEKIMIAKRLMTAIMAQKGFRSASICSTLKLSKTTVNSIRRDLEKSGEGYKHIYEKFFKIQPGARRMSRLFSALHLPTKGSRSSMSRWKKALSG